MTFLEFAPEFVYRLVVVLLGMFGIILNPFFGFSSIYMLGLFDRELFKGKIFSALGWLLSSAVFFGLWLGSIYLAEIVISWK